MFRTTLALAPDSGSVSDSVSESQNKKRELLTKSNPRFFSLRDEPSDHWKAQRNVTFFFAWPPHAPRAAVGVEILSAISFV